MIKKRLISYIFPVLILVFPLNVNAQYLGSANNTVLIDPERQIQQKLVKPSSESVTQIEEAINFAKKNRNWRETTAIIQKASIYIAQEEFYRTDDQRVIARVLFQYRQPQNDGSKSSLFTLLLDCVKPSGTYELKNVRNYSEDMGRGRLIGGNEINDGVQPIPDDIGTRLLWPMISYDACSRVSNISLSSMLNYKDSQRLISILESPGQKQISEFQINDEKLMAYKRIEYEKKSYGEKISLPGSLKKVSSAREYVAACVAATLAVRTTAKGTNFDTREAQKWGNAVIRIKEQFPDPYFNSWLEKWYYQFIQDLPYDNLLYFERCKRDFPTAETTKFVR